MRDCCQVYDADRAARGQKPAFTEDLSTPVLIEGEPFFRRGHNQQKEWFPAPGPECILKLSNPPGDCSHGLSSAVPHCPGFDDAAARSNSETRASMSSISMPRKAACKTTSAARTRLAAGSSRSVMTRSTGPSAPRRSSRRASRKAPAGALRRADNRRVLTHRLPECRRSCDSMMEHRRTQQQECASDVSAARAQKWM